MHVDSTILPWIDSVDRPPSVWWGISSRGYGLCVRMRPLFKKHAVGKSIHSPFSEPSPQASSARSLTLSISPISVIYRRLDVMNCLTELRQLDRIQWAAFIGEPPDALQALYRRNETLSLKFVQFELYHKPKVRSLAAGSFEACRMPKAQRHKPAHMHSTSKRLACTQR